MFGTAGGIIEFRAALLASRGFAALALPYFDYEDLPKDYNFNLEYFEVTFVLRYCYEKLLKMCRFNINIFLYVITSLYLYNFI